MAVHGELPLPFQQQQGTSWRAQADLRDIMGSVPDHHNKVGKAGRNLFAGGGSCLQFVKNATPVKLTVARDGFMYITVHTGEDTRMSDSWTWNCWIQDCVP